MNLKTPENLKERLVLKGGNGNECLFSKYEWRPLRTLMLDHCPWSNELKLSRLKDNFKLELSKEECEWVADCLNLAVHKIEPMRAGKEKIEMFSHPYPDGTESRVHISKIDKFVAFLKECGGCKTEN